MSVILIKTYIFWKDEVNISLLKEKIPRFDPPFANVYKFKNEITPAFTI